MSKEQHEFSVLILLLINNASQDQPWNPWRRPTHSCQPNNSIYHGCTCDRPVSVISSDIVESITRKALAHCLTSKIGCLCSKGQPAVRGPAERISHQFITTCLQLQWEWEYKSTCLFIHPFISVVWYQLIQPLQYTVWLHVCHRFFSFYFFLTCRSQFFEWVLRYNKILKWPFSLPC